MREHDTPEIPYGYCQCGCGQKTTIAKWSEPKWGVVKGEPRRYLRNHHLRTELRNQLSPPNPSGLCMCGCGRKVERANRTDSKNGHIEGEYVRVVRGHKVPSKPLYIVDLATGCWNWTGHLDKDGYGRKRHNNRVDVAHRYMFERTRGPIPIGFEIDHLCANPSCVNPDHLEPVTRTENIRRSAKAKLSEDQVLRIRTMLPAHTNVALGKAFGVSPTTISRIRIGKSWQVETTTGETREEVA